MIEGLKATTIVGLISILKQARRFTFMLKPICQSMYVGVNEQAYMCNYTLFVSCTKLPVVAFLFLFHKYHITLYCSPTGGMELHTYYSKL